MPGCGIDNVWALVNTHWSVIPPDRVDPDGKVFIVWSVGKYPERLHPCWAETAEAWKFMSPVYDSLMVLNPWTHADMPWLARKWEHVNVTGEPSYLAGTKMYVKFWLRDDVKWQDGLHGQNEPVGPLRLGQHSNYVSAKSVGEEPDHW